MLRLIRAGVPKDRRDAWFVAAAYRDAGITGTPWRELREQARTLRHVYGEGRRS
jgi:hypothetical protein